MDDLVDIINSIFGMERVTFSIRLQQDKFMKRWESCIVYIKPMSYQYQSLHAVHPKTTRFLTKKVWKSKMSCPKVRKTWSYANLSADTNLFILVHILMYCYSHQIHHSCTAFSPYCLDFLQSCLTKAPKQRPTLDQLRFHPWLTYSPLACVGLHQVLRYPSTFQRHAC